MTYCKGLLLLLLFLLPVHQYAQIGDIKEKVKEDRKNRSKKSDANENTSSSRPTFWSNNDDDYEEESSTSNMVGDFIFDAISSIFIKVQTNALANKEKYPERVSLEVPLNYGIATTNGVTDFNLGLKGNWGVFATDFKYVHLNDRQDKLKSLEWVIGIIRIPIKSLKLEYGLGINRVLDLSTTYLKSHAGMDLRIKKTNISAYYEWTGKTTLNSRFKQNVTVRIDHELKRIGKLRISPMVQYEYQNYFNSIDFHFVNAGVMLYLF